MLEVGLIPALHSPALALRGAPHVRSPEPVPTGAARSPAAVSIASRSAAPRFERPVVILAAPRSGSSLVFETLAHSPDLYTVGGESHQQFESIPALRAEAHAYQSGRLDRHDAAPEILAALRQSFAQSLRNRDGKPPSAAAGAVRLLEKTPKNALRLPLLDALFPDALYVFLYREPQENVSSIIEGWESGRFVMYPDLPGWPGPPWSFLLVPGWRELAGQPLAAIAAAQWQRTLAILLDDLEAVPRRRVCALTYRDFLADPSRQHRPDLCLRRHRLGPQASRRSAPFEPHVESAAPGQVAASRGGHCTLPPSAARDPRAGTRVPVLDSERSRGACADHRELHTAKVVILAPHAASQRDRERSLGCSNHRVRDRPRLSASTGPCCADRGR